MKNPNVNSVGPFLRIESSSDKETRFVRRELIMTVSRMEKAVLLEGLVGNSLAPLVKAEFDSENTAAAFATRVVESLSQAAGR